MDGKTTIYLVRHAEAEGNVYRRVQGQYNSRITLLGEKQLVALTERFKDITYDAVICSDLLRAKYTAQKLADIRELQVVENKLLREINVGCWEDRPWGNLAREYPEQMDHFINNIEKFSVPGAEDIISVKKRMKEAIMQIAQTYNEKIVVVVSHGTAINAFFSDVLGMTFSEVKRKFSSGDNTAVSLFTVSNNKIDISFINDATHLTKEISTYFRQKKWRESEKQMDGVYFAPIRCQELRKICHDIPVVSEQEKIEAVRVKIEDKEVGFIIMDLNADKDRKAGRILYCWIDPRYRLKRIGMQLVGHAVHTFRRLGRDYVIVAIEEKDEHAMSFFSKAGFIIEKIEGKNMILTLDIRV